MSAAEHSLVYGQALLNSQVRTDLVAAGFDPSIGFALRQLMESNSTLAFNLIP
jgi:hypothetical protein